MVHTPAALARAVYDAAGAHFDSLPFWERYGSRTVERLELETGARVLDVCSGTGGSAIAAARAVGPSGTVVAIDVSSSLLGLAEAKAAAAGADNVTFRVADMTGPALDDERSFDATVIVFGLFFAPDMVQQLRSLAKTLRPGGKLAVTVWGERLFEPLYGVLRDAVRRHRPLEDEYRPWDRVTTASDLRALFDRAGLRDVAIAEEAGELALASPNDFWRVVLGSGLRWLLDELPPAAIASIREECALRFRPVIEMNVIYAIANYRGENQS